MEKENIIRLGDFGTVENKELVEKELFRRIKPKVGSWAGRCYQKRLQAPYQTASFRTVVFPKAPNEEDCILLEGITPETTGSLKFVEQTMNVKPRGFYQTYTDADMKYGFDPLVPILTDSVANNALGVVDQIAYKAWLNGNQVWTAANGLDRNLFIKLRISLKKFTNVKNQKIKAILTPEDVADLRLKYNVGGQNLFQDTTLNEQSVLNGVIGRFEGVDIEECDDACMYSEDGKKRFAIFYCLDSEGRQPVGLISPDEAQGVFITKGLGSSGTDDPLDQRGSIGVKFMGLGAMITSEEVLARVEITPATDGIGNVDSGFDAFGNMKYDGKTLERTNVREEVASPKQKMILDLPVSTVAKTKVINYKVYNTKGDVITPTAKTANADIATVAAGKITGVKAGKVAINLTLEGYTPLDFMITVID